MNNFLLSFNISYLYSVLNVLSVIVPILLGIAWITVFERKLLAILQRRTGPNIVGWENYKIDLFLLTNYLY